MVTHLGLVKRADLPGGTVGKNPPVSAGDTGSVREGPVSLSLREDPTCLGVTKPVHCNY